MKLLMTTSADSNLRGYAPYTLPIQKIWAKKWGADYRVLDDPAYSRRAMWCYRTLIFYDLLEEYDRIFYVDADSIINKNCPNIFEVVPYDTIGAVLEDKGSRRKERLNRIRRVKSHLGEIDWQEGFLNMGVYVVSRVHRDIFQRVNGKLWEDTGWDSPFYSYQIMKQGHKYVDLGYKWNHMSMFSEPWNGSPSRFDSYVMHYAGGAKFPDKGGRSMEQLIRDDVKKIYGDL